MIHAPFNLYGGNSTWAALTLIIIAIIIYIILENRTYETNKPY